jgi:hypothetical protein
MVLAVVVVFSVDIGSAVVIVVSAWFKDLGTRS